MYRQCELRSDDHRLTCWLADDRVKPGVLVTLRADPEARWWEVLNVGTVRLDAPPDKRWKVGGLL